MKRQAFSLIELTIVLVVISILLAAIVKGRFIVNSLKMKQDFSRHFQRLYEDFYKYSTLSIELKGYESILGDGVENGGYENSPDGFIDTDVPPKRIDYLFGSTGNFSEVEVLYNYNGTRLPYAKNSSISSYVKKVDSTFFNEFEAKGNYYVYSAYDGSLARVYFGADRSGSETGNLIIVCLKSIVLAEFYDKMVDGKANGEKGRLVLLGYKYSDGCVPEPSASCSCSGGVCVGKGMNKGCRFPLCPPETASEVCVGARVD